MYVKRICDIKLLTNFFIADFALDKSFCLAQFDNIVLTINFQISEKNSESYVMKFHMPQARIVLFFHFSWNGAYIKILIKYFMSS